MSRESAVWAAARSYFQDDDHEIVGERTLRVSLELAHGTFELYVHVRAGGQVLCFAPWPQVVDAARRPAVMELVTRINVELTVSWLELDLDRGVVSARTAAVAPQGQDPDELIGDLAGMCLRTIDRFAPAIEAVAVGDLQPADLERAGETPTADVVLNMDAASDAEVRAFFDALLDD